MKMTFLKLFLNCMFNEPNLAEKKKKKLAENLLKVELRGVHGVFFPCLPQICPGLLNTLLLMISTVYNLGTHYS